MGRIIRLFVLMLFVSLYLSGVSVAEEVVVDTEVVKRQRPTRKSGKMKAARTVKAA